MTKVCIKCRTKYPATTDYFYRQRAGKFGLGSWCKLCYQQYNQQYRKSRYEYQKWHRNTLKGHLYQIYFAIKQRCDDPERKDYKWYGGRGIKNKFLFFEDFYNYIVENLGITSFDQIKGLQIDRIENDGHYEPGNIRFVTRKVNNNNKRKYKRKEV